MREGFGERCWRVQGDSRRGWRRRHGWRVGSRRSSDRRGGLVAAAARSVSASVAGIDKIGTSAAQLGDGFPRGCGERIAAPSDKVLPLAADCTAFQELIDDVLVGL